MKLKPLVAACAAFVALASQAETQTDRGQFWRRQWQCPEKGLLWAL